MSDWQLDNGNAPQSQTQSKEPLNAQDWSIDAGFNGNDEDLTSSILKAPGRILEDIINQGLNFAKNVPRYVEQGKTEVPGLLKTLGSLGTGGNNSFKQMAQNVAQGNPSQNVSTPRTNLALQGLAGSQELINSIAQLPRNLVNYGVNRLHLLPQAASTVVNSLSPEDTTNAINQLFGPPQYSGEALLRGVIRDLPQLYTAGRLSGNALQQGRAIMQGEITPRMAGRAIQNNYNLMDTQASNDFEHVGNEVVRRQIPHAPINQALDDRITAMKDYLPKTDRSRQLINDARTGDYQALRDLQTDLFHRGNKRLNSDLASDNNEGERMLEDREHINNAISDNLINTGNSDLNVILNRGRNTYRNMQEIYHPQRPKNPPISNLVGENQHIPDNLLNVLQQDSENMQRVRNANPQATNLLQRHLTRQNALTNLKRLGTIAGISYGAHLMSPAIKSIKNMFQ